MVTDNIKILHREPYYHKRIIKALEKMETILIEYNIQVCIYKFEWHMEHSYLFFPLKVVYKYFLY